MTEAQTCIYCNDSAFTFGNCPALGKGYGHITAAEMTEVRRRKKQAAKAMREAIVGKKVARR